jgi:hypothetical protein
MPTGDNLVLERSVSHLTPGRHRVSQSCPLPSFRTAEVASSVTTGNQVALGGASHRNRAPRAGVARVSGTADVVEAVGLSRAMI